MDPLRRALIALPIVAALAITAAVDPVSAQRAVPRQAGAPVGRGGAVAVPRPAPTGTYVAGGPGPRPGPVPVHGYPGHGYPVYGYPRYGYGYYPGPYFGFSTGFYPWGWGGFGFGVYFGQPYDPWFYGYPGSPYYFGGVNYAYYGPTYGSMKLNVTPNTATVYVDGYFAGTAKDLGGSFHELRLEPGTHVVDIKAEGYEPLSLNIRATPSQTIKYSGELKAH
jgi:hypothetical protein